MRHFATVEHLPHMGVWVAWCSRCGEISLGLPEDDAWDVALRHRREKGPGKYDDPGLAALRRAVEKARRAGRA